ncbi:MAG: RNA polymerase factor sigma-54, partial [Sphingomonadales bacterium]|nr:RNA polymerase factor sigma-54 [Sphingomonadales bacterium]
LQLDELDELDAPMDALVENLELLGKRDIAALKKVTGLNQDDLMDMVRTIQSLNPKPGLAFAPAEHVDTLIPDVFVRKNPAGMWTVELNTDALPKVLVNTQYYTELTSLAGAKKDKAYISECYSTANWLVKALDQRARTVMKVASELVRQQEGFFTFGVRHLKPLNLRAIAEAIEMHESTVSRVTTNKYIVCPRGTFEMKYFFTSAIQGSDGGEAHSAESVRYSIKELVDAEDPKKILSDDKLVTLLKSEGMDIARRTVAKYREAMNIPSSVERRRIKRMGL